MIINIEDCIETPVKFSTFLYCALCGTGFLTFLYIYGGESSPTWTYALLVGAIISSIAYPVITVRRYKVQFHTAAAKYEKYLLSLDEKALEQLRDCNSLNKHSAMKVNEVGYLKFGEKHVQ